MLKYAFILLVVTELHCSMQFYFNRGASMSMSFHIFDFFCIRVQSYIWTIR